MPVTVIKQPTKGSKRGTIKETIERVEKLVFFDPIDLFKTALSSTSYRAKIHIGMGNFVDEPMELYESMAWFPLIKVCSGDGKHISCVCDMRYVIADEGHGSLGSLDFTLYGPAAIDTSDFYRSACFARLFTLECIPSNLAWFGIERKSFTVFNDIGT